MSLRRTPIRASLVTSMVLAALLLLAACNVSDPRLDEPIPDGLDSSEMDVSSDDTTGQGCPACTAPANADIQSCPEDTCNYVCESGYVDKNRDLPSGSAGDGCESVCTQTNGGTEVCDGLDNDCNGRVDDGLIRTCGQTDTGRCAFGEEVCRDGVWSDCEGAVNPETEVCDDRDNDCDGSVDENLTRTCGTNVGNCQEGEQQCRNGDWGPCNGDVEPSDEFCNDIDDDCDGSVDENVKVEYYEDADGDGWGTDPILACRPSGNHNAVRGGDCDDSDEDINPGLNEYCFDSSVDRDCDGEPACGDSDCEDKQCNNGGLLGQCQNGTCVTR